MNACQPFKKLRLNIDQKTTEQFKQNPLRRFYLYSEFKHFIFSALNFILRWIYDWLIDWLSCVILLLEVRGSLSLYVDIYIFGLVNLVSLFNGISTFGGYFMSKLTF